MSAATVSSDFAHFSRDPHGRPNSGVAEDVARSPKPAKPAKFARIPAENN
jgi:hypothetical protein